MKDLAQEFTQRFWVGNLDTRLPLLVAFIAIILLTHSLARLTWNVLPQPQLEDTPTAQQAQPLVQRVAREQPLANKITGYNLFGKFEAKKVVVAPTQPVEVPETRLNLKLRGVFASEDQDAARAIIADSRGDEDSYSIGSQLPGGAILNEIYADRVILEHNGRLETLKLPVDDMPESGAGSSATANAGGAAVTPANRVSSGSISPSNIGQASANTQDNAALLGQYRDALMSDPNSVMGLVNVRPYQKDGQLVGYRIRPGKDRALLRRFGLRSGDVVTAVNGVPMNNPVKALEVLRDLSSATQLTVDIERNGSPQSFTFQIQ